jgi:hypothetical protein
MTAVSEGSEECQRGFALFHDYSSQDSLKPFCSYCNMKIRTEIGIYHSGVAEESVVPAYDAVPLRQFL